MTKIEHGLDKLLEDLRERMAFDSNSLVHVSSMIAAISQIRKLGIERRADVCDPGMDFTEKQKSIDYQEDI